MVMKIRTYQDGDKQDVIKLWNKVFSYQQDYNRPEAVIEDKLKVQGELFYVGHIEKQLISTVLCGYDGHRGWLYCLAVDPIHQKLGYGKQMVMHALNELKTLGAVKINLQIYDENKEVESFYLGLGFNKEPRISMGMLLR